MTLKDMLEKYSFQKWKMNLDLQLKSDTCRK